MKAFKSICLHATTEQLQTLHEHLDAIYPILRQAFEQQSSQVEPCLCWEAVASMRTMVIAELNYRTESHARAQFIANSLLEEEAVRSPRCASLPS